MTATVRRATPADAAAVGRLFDAYRVFYEQPAAPEACEGFIRERLERDESVVFVAEDADGRPVGFTQLYSSFCSVALKPIVYLYDLFVDPDHRRGGVAMALMQAAEDHARSLGADRLTLETHRSNEQAQGLYRHRGWEQDVDFLTFHLDLSGEN